MTSAVFLGASPEGPVTQRFDKINRHGLIAGATGTGKTVTLKVLAQAYSEAGIPVFVADVKGDLSGLAEAGSPRDFLTHRAQDVGLEDYFFHDSPTVFWDLEGTRGMPPRATVSELGPVLLSRLLGLTDAQEGVLHIAFRLADEEGLLVLDLKDLRALLVHIGNNAQEIRATHGMVSPASVGAIQRRLLALENEGGDRLFGEPSLEVADLARPGPHGQGPIHLLVADKLIATPLLYSTVMLWILSELYEDLPEVGDTDKPVLALFLDEAHLLFSDTPKALVDKITQVTRLIRSKGVGIYFVTQSPRDIPDPILAQLGTRIQHGLRAYTPGERTAIKAVADGFRPNPAFDTGAVVTELATGEALVSTLDDRGAPTVVQRTLIRPPACSLNPVNDRLRARLIASHPDSAHYARFVDRESAYEILTARAEARVADGPEDEDDSPRGKGKGKGKKGRSRVPSSGSSGSRRRGSDSIAETAMKSVVRSVGRSLGREIVRGLLGSIFRSR
ncbi:helicase HerA-like domain-containing protein [Rhodospirillum sp. A1_3_36]|uniref:helicase HerA-like domain-containing protein n=1 Tax=Rhodospirillum sp. A1_3_36 TaxID=3391666 RepID=UPI0039A6FBE0